MKRALFWICGGLLALLVIGYVTAEFLLGSAVRAGVNRFGPGFTQTRVTLDGASISPFTGSGTLTGLLVGNPKGWSSDKAFYLGKVHVAIVPGSLFSDHIVIDDVTIDKPEFVYETKIVSSNVGDLLKNLQGTSSGTTATPQKPVSKSGTLLKFEIRHLAITNARVTIGIGPTALTLPMPPLVLTNVGTSAGGITPDELATEIMERVVPSIVGTAASAAGKLVPAATSGAAEAAKNALQGLFSGKK